MVAGVLETREIFIAAEVHLLLPKLLNFYYQYQALLGIFKQIIGQKFKSLAPKCKKILIGPLQP